MDKMLQQLPQDIQGELAVHKGTSVQVKYENSEFQDISNTNLQNSTLRLIKDGRMSVASSTKPNSEQELLENAMSTLAFGSETNIGFPGAAKLPMIELVDERVPEIDTKTMVEIAEDLTMTLVNYDSRIRVMAGVQKADTEFMLTNSAGFTGSYRKTTWGAFLGGQLIQGEDMLWLGEFRSSCSLLTDFSELKQEMLRQFDLAKNTVPFEAGSYPVIFAPSQVGFLTNPFLACLNGKSIVRNISPWKERIGEKLLDPKVTLVDDGTLPMHPSSQPFDREGIPTRRNVLIDAGVAQQMLLDLQCAKELGAESTGNGTTGGPNPHHVLLMPGQTALDAMIKQIDKGLIIFASMGAWTGNPYSGNVSGTISMGLKIERGEIVGRVKDCMFSINAFDHFRDNLIDCSQETLNLGSATFPYVALNDVGISTK